MIIQTWRPKRSTPLYQVIYTNMVIPNMLTVVGSVLADACNLFFMITDKFTTYAVCQTRLLCSSGHREAIIRLGLNIYSILSFYSSQNLYNSSFVICGRGSNLMSSLLLSDILIFVNERLSRLSALMTFTQIFRSSGGSYRPHSSPHLCM